MFPLQRGNELVIQFSNSPLQQHQISEDLILVDDDYSASLDFNDSHKLFSPSNHSNKNLFYGGDDADEDHGNNSSIVNHKKKKMAHREIERQRRQDMASLYSSLRSLLPLHFIKGKRSISEHMNEAVNYIKHMQENIKELGSKRDQLKRLSNSSNLEKNNNDDDENNKTTTSACSSFIITVHENNNNNGVVGIEINSGIIREEELRVSKLMQLLLEEGLEVVSYISTKVNGTLVHNLQCEVARNSSSVDLPVLRRKLANLVPISFGCSD